MGRDAALLLSLVALVLVAAGVRTQAWATDGYGAALALYEAGEYESAMHAAEALDDAGGLALAARSQLVLARFFLSAEEKEVALKRAIELSQKAVAMNPDHIEANLQAAIALGYRGRLQRSSRDARQARRHIEAALEVEPHNPWALAALGGWHGEVVMEAGTFFARAFFNAGRSDAIRHYEEALEIAPDNIPIRASFAKTLLRFERKRYLPRAERLLEQTVAKQPVNAFDRLIRDEAQEILTTLQSGDSEALKSLLDRTAPFSRD